MTLNLIDVPRPAARPRSVIPACLQHRAPLRYEIRDGDDRALPPTLAGHKLRRGATYKLRVQTQDGTTDSFAMRLLAPRAVFDHAGADEKDDGWRTITFHTSGPGTTDYWRHFRSEVTNLPVHLEFADGREPYSITIPVVLLASRYRWIASLLLSALLSMFAVAPFQERFFVPDMWYLAVFAVVWVVFGLTCECVDLWVFWQKAKRLMAANHEGFQPHRKSHETG